MYNISLMSINKNNLFYRIHPAFKIVVTLLFSIVFLFIKNVYIIGFCVLLSFILLLCAREKISNIFRYIYSLKWFYIFIFVFNYLVLKNFALSIVSVGQMLSVLLCNLFLIRTTSEKDLEYGIYVFLRPLSFLHINVSTLVLIISLIIRFIPEIIDCENKILICQYNRGISFKHKNIVDRIRMIYASIIPLINMCIKKADDMAITMEVRCYDVNNFRCKKRRIKNYDIIFLTVSIILFSVLAFWKVNL